MDIAMHLHVGSNQKKWVMYQTSAVGYAKIGLVGSRVGIGLGTVGGLQ